MSLESDFAGPDEDKALIAYGGLLGRESPTNEERLRAQAFRLYRHWRGDPDEAHQEALLHIYENRVSYNPALDWFRWAKRVHENKVIDVRRKKAKPRAVLTQELPDRPPSQPVDWEADKAWFFEATSAMLATHDGWCRDAAVVLRLLFDERSAEEIGFVFNKAEKTVYHWLNPKKVGSACHCFQRLVRTLKYRELGDYAADLVKDRHKDRVHKILLAWVVRDHVKRLDPGTKGIPGVAAACDPSIGELLRERFGDCLWGRQIESGRSPATLANSHQLSILHGEPDELILYGAQVLLVSKLRDLDPSAFASFLRKQTFPRCLVEKVFVEGMTLIEAVAHCGPPAAEIEDKALRNHFQEQMQELLDAIQQDTRR